MYEKQIAVAEASLVKLTKAAEKEEIIIQKKIDKHNSTSLAKYNAKKAIYDNYINSLPFVPVLKPSPKQELLQLEDGYTSVILGVRPEGFILDENGPLQFSYEFNEVIGRDNVLVCNHENAMKKSFRVILSEDVVVPEKEIKATLKEKKYFVFNPLTGERII
jgi:ABC-type sugar transport system ATPase subunit